MLQNARLNAAKRKAKCSKTQGKMVQNAGQNGAKRRVRWCKTHREMHNFSRCAVVLSFAFDIKVRLLGVKRV